MLKPDEGVLEAPNAQLKREKYPIRDVKLKRERHQHRRPDVNRPSDREHLLETYSVKYEFCAQQIGRVYQDGIKLIFCPADASKFEKRAVDQSSARVQCLRRRTNYIRLLGHLGLCGLVKDCFGGSRKSNQSKWKRS